MMGTNYFTGIDPCHVCGRSDEVEHLGKLSSGCRFILYVGDKYSNFAEFKAFISAANVVVYNEYGDEIGSDALLRWISQHAYQKGAADCRTDGAVDLCPYEFS